jgi:hypothetical protein
MSVILIHIYHRHSLKFQLLNLQDLFKIILIRLAYSQFIDYFQYDVVFF